MPATYLLRFREGVTWRVMGPADPPELGAEFELLASAGATTQAMSDRIFTAAGAGGLARLLYYLHLLRERGCLTYTVLAGGEPLATLVPMSGGVDPGRFLPVGSRQYRLSRFALLRRSEGGLILESPLAPARLRLHSPRAALIMAELSDPQGVSDLTSCGLETEEAEALLGLLDCGGLLTEVGPTGESMEDADPALAHWEFHDLLFHARSRLGRHDDPIGAAYELRGRFDALPAVKEPAGGPGVELPRPDMGRLAAADRPLTEVLEARKSIRTPGVQPITLQQVGEFLYRTGRVRFTRPAGDRVPYEVTGRPYPGGGGCYELELYLTVNACADLDPGVYHYDPLGHRLTKVAEPSAQTRTLVSDAWNATARQGVPQVLITFAARFRRVSWKYRAMAYAAILKNVGVLYQTMYLVAESMRLAPCALGVGNSDLFSRVIGSNYYEESSVGEFLLGSR